MYFGLGTPKSGTTSLGALLAAQNIGKVIKDAGPHLEWQPTENEIQRRCENYMRYSFAGDVSWDLLNAIPRLLELYPGSRCICLQRDRDTAISSMNDFIGTKLDRKGFPGLPIAEYYDKYYEIATQWQTTYPDFKIFSTDMLNTPQQLLDWWRITQAQPKVFKLNAAPKKSYNIMNLKLMVHNNKFLETLPEELKQPILDLRKGCNCNIVKKIKSVLDSKYTSYINAWFSQ